VTGIAEEPMRDPLSLRRSLAVLALASALAASLASQVAAQSADRAGSQARSASRPAAATPAQAQARVLTPGQLKDCMAQQARVEGDLAEGERERASIEALKNDLKTSGQVLDAALAGLDRTDAAAVEAHNAKVKERDARIDAYGARVTAYNARAEGMKASRDAWVRSCDGRRYDERDLQDLMKKTK
jgi:hypothetical protein